MDNQDFKLAHRLEPTRYRIKGFRITKPDSMLIVIDGIIVVRLIVQALQELHLTLPFNQGVDTLVL